MTFNPKAHRIKLNMSQPEMAEYMGWSLRKQQEIEAKPADMSRAHIDYMRKAKKTEKKKRNLR